VRRAWWAGIVGLMLVSCAPGSTGAFGPLEVTSVTPSTGGTAGGTTVTIAGSGFTQSASGGALLTVSVCGAELVDVAVVGVPRRVTLPGGGVLDVIVGATLTGVTAPAATTSAEVVVVRSDGARAVAAASFTCLPPVAADDVAAASSAPGDPWHAAFDAPWTVPAPGVLANDGGGRVASFGGVDLGGDIADHPAGSTASVDGHLVRVDADGAVTFVPAPGFTGTFSFRYRLAEVDAASDALVTLAVGERPAVASRYPHVLLGNVGIDTRRASGFRAVAGDGATLTLAQPIGGTFEVFPDGRFAFEPEPGFVGTATVTLTVENGFGVAGPTTLELDVSGRVWFVDAAAAPGGDGRRSAPFHCIFSEGCASAASAGVGDTVFLASGVYGGITGVVTLPEEARLVGAGATASLPELMERTWPVDAAAPPPTGGANPVLARGDGRATQLVTVWRDALLAGVTFAQATPAFYGVRFGTLTVHDVVIEQVQSLGFLGSGTLAGTGFRSIANAWQGPEFSDGFYLRDVEADGQFSFGTGRVRGSFGFRIVGGSGSFRFDGDVDAGLAVGVASTTGGGFVMGGMASASRIFVEDVTGDVLVAFEGPVVLTGGGTAVALSNNAASVRTVFGGGLDIAMTGGGDGIVAIDGGTLEVTGDGSSVTTASGRAMHLERTSIGAAGMSFASVRAGTETDGPLHAIRLAEVSGPGHATIAGGLIQRTTGDAVSLLNVALPGLTFDGVTWRDLPGFAVHARDASALTLRHNVVKDAANGFYLGYGDFGPIAFDVHGNTIVNVGTAVWFAFSGASWQARRGRIADNVFGTAAAPVSVGMLLMANTCYFCPTPMVLRIETNETFATNASLATNGFWHRVDLHVLDNVFQRSSLEFSEWRVCLNFSGNRGTSSDLRIKAGREGEPIILPGYVGGPLDAVAVEAYLEARDDSVPWNVEIAGTIGGAIDGTCAP
jgi:hypothetical protein